MTDRTAFEAHFKLTQRQQAQHKDGSYRDASIQDRWLGYQAGRESGITDAEAEQLRAQNQWLTDLYDATENLVNVKGRHHTEQAYQRLVKAFDITKAG